MRLSLLQFVALVVLFASCDAVATANENQIAPTSATSFVESIHRFLFAEDAKSAKEERSYNAAVSSAGEGGRTGAGVSGVSSTATTSGGTVTISKYWNNGLIQKFKRWLRKVFSPSSTRRLRQ
ncbi:hypothetical protein PHYPSEUDO_011438 [Phytophthora pseudosyringae]|uniref:RxLR effector protein n=1 Tax=Phytophthora pseudosyringae TaxID=221518 RepID=A0A8T1W6I0_9STRA|nr:hypothetical protein PHYPSEUDO_011438 [Phytophthora pseudosyringae]